MSNTFLSAKGKPDYILVLVVGLILLLGIVVLGGVSTAFSFQKSGDTYYFLRHQLLLGFLPGLLLGFLAFRMKLSLLKQWAPRLLLATLILMVMVFLPFIGSKDLAAARWIGLAGFSFQPSELLKLTFVLYLASWLASKTKGGKVFGQSFLAFLMVMALITLLLFFQSDVSTWGVIVLVALIMYFSAETPFWHSIFTLLAGGIGLLILVKLAPYRVNRFLVFLNPDLDPMGIGYQIKQGLIAVGSGGIGGVGLGMSALKYGFLPQAISDSIFTIFSEETGFLGSAFLVLLFLLFFWRGFVIAKRSQDKFLQLTALGITCWIIVQSFVNIGAMIELLPLTGIPLPFFSNGGSALVVELIGVGILLNISRQTTG